jgi:hypothetical protein
MSTDVPERIVCMNYVVTYRMEVTTDSDVRLGLKNARGAVPRPRLGGARGLDDSDCHSVQILWSSHPNFASDTEALAQDTIPLRQWNIRSLLVYLQVVPHALSCPRPQLGEVSGDESL